MNLITLLTRVGAATIDHPASSEIGRLRGFATPDGLTSDENIAMLADLARRIIEEDDQ